MDLLLFYKVISKATSMFWGYSSTLMFWCQLTMSKHLTDYDLSDISNKVQILGLILAGKCLPMSYTDGMDLAVGSLSLFC